MSEVDLAEVVGELSDDEVFDPAVWAALRAETEHEIEYTTPIKKRLRKRAIEREEELRLAAFYEMDEKEYFWRESSQKVTAGSLSNPGGVNPRPR